MKPRSDTAAGENVSTNTGSRPKKSSSQPDKYNPNTPNDWWPFKRVDGRVLVRAHRDAIQDLEEAPI